MRIVIAAGKSGLKREIEGPFSICGSREDIEQLRNEIDRALGQEPRFSYGWVEVIPARPAVQPNTHPLPWEPSA